MTAMGVSVFCNRVQINGNDQEQLMLLRTLQDNESNILGNQTHLIISKNNSDNNNGNGNTTTTAATTTTTTTTPTNHNNNHNNHNNHNNNNNNNNNNNKNKNNSNNDNNTSRSTIVTAVLPPYDTSRLKKHGKNGQPPPVAVARRNARERNRVKQVNNGFATLRQHIPNHIAAGYGDRGKKLSKVETLRMAVEYIRGLQRLLAEADGLEYDLNSALGSQCVPSPTSSIVSSSLNGSGEKFTIEDDALTIEDGEDGERMDDDEECAKAGMALSRLSPNRTAMASPHDYYASSVGEEENLESRGLSSNVIQNFSRLSPNSVASPPSEYYGQNEENLEPRILSPYSGAGDSEEGATAAYAASPEAFSGALYYKQEIAEPGEFMDVVSWWEQEQGRLQAQRLAHV